MVFSKRTILVSILSMAAIFSYAQSTLKGKVIDSETGEALIASTVRVMSTDTTRMVAGNATTRDGSFSIKSVKDGNYILKVSYVGYRDFFKKITVNKKENKGNMAIGTIMMTQSSIELTSAVVTAELKEMEVKDDTLIFIDPVMADNGKLYPAFDMDYAKKNTELCSKADIIVPNITEAAIMTGMEYKEDHDEAYINELINRLVKLGAKKTFLTGVSLSEGKTGVMGYDRESGEVFTYQNDKVDAIFHGTGDLFSSTLIGEIMKGKDWKDAARIAADYTAHTIAVTMENPKKPWYGVDFEATLQYLINMD